MRFFSSLFAADPSLGRVDFASLSDQCCMELLVAGLSKASRDHFVNDNGDFLDIEDWPITEVSEHGSVTSITIKYFGVGKIDLEYVPQTVERLIIVVTDLEGTVETTRLPNPLKILRINGRYTYTGRLESEYTEKGFRGEFDFCSLPSSLQTCDISYNKFTGSAIFTDLPESLEVLKLRENDFEGSIFLESLPKNLSELDIRRNTFIGSLCLSKLPRTLSFLDAAECQFSGCLIFENLPVALDTLVLNKNQLTGELCVNCYLGNLGTLDVSDNKLAGKAVVHSSVFELIHLSGNSIVAAVDEKDVPFECTRNAWGVIVRIVG